MADSVAQPPIITSGPEELKLDFWPPIPSLVPGKRAARDGFRVAALGAEKPYYAVDLFEFPWPWADNSVDEILASNVVEYIPADVVEHHGARKDRFVAFVDEAWRILKPGKVMQIVVPNVRCDRAFMDPYRRRFFNQCNFLMLSRDWRKQSNVPYPFECDFSVEVNPIIMSAQTCCPYHRVAPTQTRCDEVQSREYTHCWNTVFDWQARCVKLVQQVPQAPPP
jgi:SAM-dependent methyltransferase